MPGRQAADVSGYGFLPKVQREGLADNDMHVTVFAPGGNIGKWIRVGILHVICWVLAIGLGFEAYLKIRDITTANEQMKTLSLVAPIVYILVVLAVVVHSAFFKPAKKRELTDNSVEVLPPVVGAILLGINAFALMMAFAVVATSAVLGNSDAYMFAVLAGLFVCLASMMVFSFYINFTEYGDNYRGPPKASSQGKGTAAEIPIV